jgi:hypothetical protein
MATTKPCHHRLIPPFVATVSEISAQNADTAGAMIERASYLQGSRISYIYESANVLTASTPKYPTRACEVRSKAVA